MHFGRWLLWYRAQQSIWTRRHWLLRRNFHSRQMRSRENWPTGIISRIVGMVRSLALASSATLCYLLNSPWVLTLMSLLKFPKVKSQTFWHTINSHISCINSTLTNIFKAFKSSLCLLAFSPLLLAVLHHTRFWKLYVLLEFIITFGIALTLRQSTYPLRTSKTI